MRATTIQLTVLLMILASCQTPVRMDNRGQSFGGVYIDTFFTNLFSGDCGGYTGGDGTYSVRLPDGRTVWLFGDTFIDGVNPDNTREKQDPKFIRNSVVIQDGIVLHTLYHEINGTRASFIIPPQPEDGGKIFTEDSLWFWPGDGFIEDGKLKIFLSEFIQRDTGMWGFEWQGAWVATYELPGIIEKELVRLPFIKESGIHFGHAVFVDEPYTYVYGAGSGYPHAARYQGGDVNNQWEFFDGEGWNSHPSSAKPMADIAGSEQFSVFKLHNQYILLTQMGGFSDEICSYTADTPYGPWGNEQLLYKTPIPDSTKSLFTYNALAHPQFTEDNILLVSYNMNSMILQDHYKNAGIYRPRFIRVPLEKIIRF